MAATTEQETPARLLAASNNKNNESHTTYTYLPISHMLFCRYKVQSTVIAELARNTIIAKSARPC